MNHKKPIFWILICAVIVSAIIVVFFLTRLLSSDIASSNSINDPAVTAVPTEQTATDTEPILSATPNTETIHISEDIALQESSAESETSPESPYYPSENMTPVEYQSSLGYSVQFDPTVFTLDDTTGIDHFLYHTAEILDASVYLSIQQYTDIDAPSCADGLALQAGTDDVLIQNTTFGTDQISVHSVSYEQEQDGILRIFTFYVIPSENGVLVAEICGYDGMPQKIDDKIAEILNTFSLTSG